jgi:hypothetical protein
MPHLKTRAFTLIAAASLFAACSSAKVSPEKAVAPATRRAEQRPARIVVRDFQFAPADVQESHGVVSQETRKFSKETPSQRKQEIGKAAAEALSARLTNDLKGLGFETVEQKSAGTARGDELLVEGKFIDVDEGARLRRVVVGFGVGASKMDTQVEIYRVAGGRRQKVIEFGTHADSGKMPGAIVLAPAGAAAAGGVTVAGAAAEGAVAGGKTYNSSVATLADKTADQISAYLAHYFAERGWISAEKAKAEKVNVEQPSTSGPTE